MTLSAGAVAEGMLKQQKLRSEKDDSERVCGRGSTPLTSTINPAVILMRVSGGFFKRCKCIESGLQGCDFMREVQFHTHRKSAFAGALLPYRMYINGQYIGTIRNGKSHAESANVPKAGVYYIEDDILSSRNAVIYDNGLSEHSVVIKRAGGWRTESYNEFYMEKGNVLEQLPVFPLGKAL